MGTIQNISLYTPPIEALKSIYKASSLRETSTQWASLDQRNQYALISKSDRYTCHGVGKTSFYPLYSLYDAQKGVEFLCANLHCNTGSIQKEANIKKVIQIAQELKGYIKPSLVAGDFNISYRVEDTSGSVSRLTSQSIETCYHLATETDYVVVIPRGVTKTVRPSSIFKNAQALYKHSENCGDTMYLLVSKELFEDQDFSQDDYIVFHPDRSREDFNPTVHIYKAFSSDNFTDHRPIFYRGLAFVNLANVAHERRGFIPSMFKEDPTLDEQNAFKKVLVEELGTLVFTLTGEDKSLENTRALSETRVLPSGNLIKTFWKDPSFKVNFLNAVEEYVDKLIVSDPMQALIAKLNKEYTMEGLKETLLGISQANLKMLKSNQLTLKDPSLSYPNEISHSGIIAGMLRHGNFFYASNALMSRFQMASCSGFEIASDIEFETSKEIVDFQLAQLDRPDVDLIVGCECVGVSDLM